MSRLYLYNRDITFGATYVQVIMFQNLLRWYHKLERDSHEPFPPWLTREQCSQLQLCFALNISYTSSRTWFSASSMVQMTLVNLPWAVEHYKKDGVFFGRCSIGIFQFGSDVFCVRAMSVCISTQHRTRDEQGGRTLMDYIWCAGKWALMMMVCITKFWSHWWRGMIQCLPSGKL